ncbi:MAG: glycosyltransferase family 4 protein [Candidatus Omnitrophica bacterium]|nr:glycosyltransferase family 4 protein [Candidatus Omnitrophota bacterium]
MERPLAVRFLVANNLPVSVTRIVADTASALARMGVEASVLYPVVDWFDFKWFQITRLPLWKKARWTAALLKETLRKGLLPTPWSGQLHYRCDPRVRTNRYVWFPPIRKETEGEVLIFEHCYQLKHWLRQDPKRRQKVVSVIHNNYEEEMRSGSPESTAWKRHCVELEQSIRVPRIATSQGGKEVAQRLGIPVEEVIPNGIDLELFRPDGLRKKGRPLQVTLFCETYPQKGQAVALEALRNWRKGRDPSSVRLCSLGNLLPGAEGLFDFHYGFLHGQDYVRALQETDIFLYPSLYDGFPAPPLHAMACGAALVTTLVEGVLGYAREGENCLTCRPGDTQGIRFQIERLIEDPALRQAIRASGLQTAQAFSVERTTHQMLEFLKGVLQ